VNELPNRLAQIRIALVGTLADCRRCLGHISKPLPLLLQCHQDPRDPPRDVRVDVGEQGNDQILTPAAQEHLQD
jgi:hypothetical protein